MGGNVMIQGKLNTNRTKVQEVFADASGRLITNNQVSGISASSYDADKSVTTSSQREAIPAGAQRLWLRNNGATNFMRFRFGDSTVTATGTTGFRVNVDQVIEVTVPSTATHWAYIADTATVTASVVWG